MHNCFDNLKIGDTIIICGNYFVTVKSEKILFEEFLFVEVIDDEYQISRIYKHHIAYDPSKYRIIKNGKKKLKQAKLTKEEKRILGIA